MMPRIDLGAISVDYGDAGHGEPLVLVHGHPFDRSMWQPQADRFAGDQWRVITPDLRGYGNSTVQPGRTLLSDFADDLAQLLDRLGIGRIVLGGLSMGGQIVLEFYRLFPERVRALVFADSSPVGETPEGRQSRHDVADRLLAEGMTGYAEEVLPKMVSARTIAEKPEVAEYVLGMMRAAPPEGAAAALRGRAERPDYVELLPRVSVPMLVVVGSADEYTPVAEARLTAERVPDATLAIIEGAGHLPNLERQTEFDRALGTFLDSVAATRTTAIRER